MSDPDQITDVPTQRLCCEIQLFELCDLCSCKDKRGRFCTNPDLLDRFERIAEDELRVQERYSEEDDDDTYDGYTFDEDEEVGEVGEHDVGEGEWAFEE